VTKNSPGTHKAKIHSKSRNPRSKPASKTGRRATSSQRPGKKPSGPAVFGRGFPISPPAAASPRDIQRQQEARQSALAAIEAALDKKALVPVLLDVSGRATYTDFIGVVSGRSDRQVDAIAENVRDVMERRGSRLLGREGTGNGRWTLLDFGDVVLHVFYHPVREVYDIEGLWIDAPRVPLQVPPESQLYQPDALYGAL
jgi:ribosome-associated protein